jgi:hypothetical protein
MKAIGRKSQRMVWRVGGADGPGGSATPIDLHRWGKLEAEMTKWPT